MSAWTKFAAITVGLSVLMTGTAYAKKSDDEGHRYGHSDSHGHKNHHKYDEKHSKNRSSRYFNDERSRKINQYYSATAKAQHCPPGLAKKGYRCQAPGLTKHWVKGKRLPADVVYYSVPNNLLYELGSTPAGQKVVRVGEDVLLINAVTGLVIDVIQSAFSPAL